MGIYVEVRLYDGAESKKIGWMEINRQDDERGEENAYRFRYRGTRNGVVGGEGVLHRYTDDVMELIRRVLNHSESQPEYCGSCACQFESLDTLAATAAAEAEETLYRKVAVRGEA